MTGLLPVTVPATDGVGFKFVSEHGGVTLDKTVFDRELFSFGSVKY